MNGLKELWLRLKAPLNTFWRRMRLFLITVSALSLTVTEVLQPWLGNAYLPEWALNILQHAYMFGAFGLILTQLTVPDAEQLKQQKNG